MAIKSKMHLEILRAAIDSNKIVFAEERGPPEAEFRAMLGPISGEGRMRKFNEYLSKYGCVWAMRAGGELMKFEIEDERGKIRIATPFWPAKRYAEHVVGLLSLQAEVVRIGMMEFLDEVLLDELARNGGLVARFWLPGQRAVVDRPRKLSIERASGIGWHYGLPEEKHETHSEEEYNAILKSIYKPALKAGPKSKLP